MTSTICPQPLQPSAVLASVDAVSGPERPSRTLGWFGGVEQLVRRQAARLWGSGSATPSSQALDAVDVPSFHR